MRRGSRGRGRIVDMEPVYKKHYTRDEARQLLPRIRVWLNDLSQARAQLTAQDQRIAKALGFGDDLGGDLVNAHVKTIAKVKQLLGEFQSREIQIKDLDRGLIDFPAYVGGKEVFLCWEKDEDDIEFWHDLHTGFSGREPL